MSPRFLFLGAMLACKDGGGDAPPDDEVVTVDLGSHTLDADGFTGPVTVDVPDGAISTIAYCGGYGDSGLGALWTLDDAGGTRVYDGDAPNPSTYRAEFLDDMAPALVPITPALDLTPGAWTFNWYVEPAAGQDNLSCEAAFRVDEPSDSPAVFVELVFVAVPGLDASSAPDDANFQSVLGVIEDSWGSQGVTPTFSYIDFAGDATRFGVVNVSDDDYSEFNDLLRTTSPAGSRTLTFFLVEEIANSSSGGSTILGLSAGPPGAATFSATSKSGVIVTTVDIATAPQDVGKIMAHEGGHFLGLFHPVEKDGSAVDPIGDTPVCSDDGGDGTLNTADCAGQGAENIMWWTLADGDQTFSPDQAWVIARNPVAD